MRIAQICTAHGFGHMTRQLAIAEELEAAGHETTFFAPRPDLIRQSHPSIAVRPRTVDVGISQTDSLKMDISGTRRLLEQRCSEREIDLLAEELRNFEGVIADIPPAGLEASRRAGIPAVAMGNFDWAWIYRSFPELEDWAEKFSQWQRAHPAVFISPGPGLFGFSQLHTAQFVARSAQKHRLEKGSVLVSFGGFGLNELGELLPEIDGVRWILSGQCRTR